MTAVLPTAAPRSLPTTAPPPSFGARLRFSWRLLRRGAMLMWLTVGLYMTIEVLTFREVYPDAESRRQLLELSTSTAVRMMQGVPGAVDTAGGFAVWDAGWMLMVIVASWALLTATRLTRGEEDSGRVELVLCRPSTARQALGANLAALAIAVAGIGFFAALPFVLLGEPVDGALLWGLGLALFGGVTASLGVLVAQLVEPRRRAIAVSLGLAAAAFVLRIVANSADSRAWVSTVAPFGWVDRMRAFGDNHWLWLMAPSAAAFALGGAALIACARRDTGAAILRSSEHHRSRLHLLRTATGFGWRLTAGALLAWALTLAVLMFVFGLMTGALIDLINKDETYRRMLESMGMDMSMPAIGYLSYIGMFLALPLAAFTGWRIGAVRQEEADGRLDNLLVRGVVRWRWLALTAGYAFVAAVILVVASALGLWLGTTLVDAPVTLSQVIEPMAGTLPVIALYIGIAVLVFAIAPRLTVAVPVTLAVLGYLLETFGTALKWPNVVVGISPFHHLARLPGAPMPLGAIVVLTLIGLASATVGVIAFCRRDLHGA